MASPEADIVPLWLASYKLDDTGLEVWQDEVPRNQALPAIIISMQGNSDVSYVGTRIAIHEEVWQVKAVAASKNYDSVSGYAQQIQDALQGASTANVEGYDIISCKRQSIIRYRDDIDVAHVHMGGLYRVQIAKR